MQLVSTHESRETQLIAGFVTFARHARCPQHVFTLHIPQRSLHTGEEQVRGILDIVQAVVGTIGAR